MKRWSYMLIGAVAVPIGLFSVMYGLEFIRELLQVHPFTFFIVVLLMIMGAFVGAMMHLNKTGGPSY